MSDFSIQPAGHGPLNSVRNVPSLSHPGANGVRPAAPSNGTQAAGASGRDRVELSDRARLLAMMRDMPEVRQDRIDRVRGAIDRGVYETNERIDATVQRMIQQEDLLSP